MAAQLDRERQPVETADDAAYGLVVERYAGSSRRCALGEQVGGGVLGELAEREDPLRGDRERGPGGGDHAKLAARRHQERDQVGHRGDDVLAVVEDQQRGRLVEELGDAGADVVALLGGEDPAAADRVADAQRRADLAHDVVRRGDADQLHEVHHRLLGPAAEQVGEPRLAEASGAEDRGHPGFADSRPQRPDVLVTTDQRGRLEPQPGPDRAVRREQLPVQGLQRGSGVDAQPVGEVRAVALEGLERGRRTLHSSDRAKQRDRRCLVTARLLQQREGLVVVTERRQGPAEHRGRDRAMAGRLPPQLTKRSVGSAARLGERERRPGQVARADHVLTTFALTSTDHGVAKHQGVDRFGTESEPVAVVGAGHHLGGRLGPSPGHHDLQRLGWVGRHVVRSPDLRDQPLLAHLSTRRHQRGQQRLGAAARQRGALPGDLVEQPEVDHADSLAICSALSRSPAASTFSCTCSMLPVPGMTRT